MGAAIIVVGSLNADLVARVDRLPAAGATVSARELRRFCGGKGANQAVAAARLGGRVRMVGRVGEDEAGAALIEDLSRAGVDVTRVRRTAGVATGVALIAVQADGENHIIVVPGANESLSVDDVEIALDEASPGDYLLLQLESPAAVVERAARIAHSKGLTVVLDPAPVRPLSRACLQTVTILTPNEHEAMALVGRPGATLADDAIEGVAAGVRSLGVETAIVKLGARGVAIADRAGVRRLTGIAVSVVDTTAAGDTFNGALAVALADGQRIDRAAAFANAAAALSVTRAGAQASMPSREDVERLSL